MNVGYAQSGHNTSGSQSMESGCQIGGSTGRGSLGRANTGSLGGNRGSLASVGKPTSSTLASLAGLLSSNDIKLETKSETSFSSKLEKEEVFQRVRVSSNFTSTFWHKLNIKLSPKVVHVYPINYQI